jgi:hypothetical protein
MYLIPRHLRAEKNIFDAVVVARGALLSRNSTDNSRKRNELHVESGGLFSDSF